jgi:hypothetical protein
LLFDNLNLKFIFTCRKHPIFQHLIVARMLIWLTFLTHAWKKLRRGTFFGQNLAIQILLGFVGLYFLLLFGLVGFLLPNLLEDSSLTGDSLQQKFANLILYWTLGDVLLRYFLENLNVIESRHYLLHPIRKSNILHYLLVSSLPNYFNILSLILIFPFYFRGILPEVGWLPGLFWLTGILSLLGFHHYLAIYLKRQTALKNATMLILGGVLALVLILERYEVVSLMEVSRFVFGQMSQIILLPLACMLALTGVYLLNYRLLQRYIYEDAWATSAGSTSTGKSFALLENLGESGFLAAQELKLIFRNKRTRNVFWLSVALLLYGFLFYPQEQYHTPLWQLFVGIFITGTFMINYGQFITAWDSAYWDGILTRRLALPAYFQAKWLLLIFSSVIAYLLTLPYGFFGADILLTQSVAFLYNIGVNSFVLLLFSAMSSKRIDLTKSNMMNYQGTGLAQFLIMVPILMVPMMLIGFFSFWDQTNTGLIVLAAISLLSLAAYPLWMREIQKWTLDNKYKKAEGFRKK